MPRSTIAKTATAEREPQSKTDLKDILCDSAPNQDACEAFVERLQEANDNIKPHL